MSDENLVAARGTIGRLRREVRAISKAQIKAYGLYEARIAGQAATIARVRSVADKWHSAFEAASYDDERASVKDDCADEIDAALKERD